MVYISAKDAPDRRFDLDGTIHCSMMAMNSWFLRESGGYRWRFDTYQSGKGARARQLIDVSFVRSALRSQDLAGGDPVQRELEARGFDRPDKRYLAFVEAKADYCGSAVYPVYSPTVAHPNGQFSEVILLSPDACHADEFGAPGNELFAEMIAAQEIMHNDGLVPFNAPHSCVTVPPMTHVCTPGLVQTESASQFDPERLDVMFPYVNEPLSQKRLDIGNDDYFNHPYPGMYDLENSPFVIPAEA